MSIVAPIASTGVALPVIVGLIGGDRPGAAALGRPGARGRRHRARLARGRRGRGATPRQQRLSIVLAIVAGLGFGSYFVLAEIGSSGDVGWALLLSRTVGVSDHRGDRDRRRCAAAARDPAAARWLALAGIGLLDLGANVAYNYATTIGELSSVAVASSLYPVTTVLLAALLLGERVQGVQRVGVVVALAGVVLIAAGAERRHAPGRPPRLLSAFPAMPPHSPPPRSRSSRCSSRRRSRSASCTSCARAARRRTGGRCRRGARRCFYSGLALIAITLVLAARRAGRRAVLGAHGRAPAARRPRRAAARARPHRASCWRRCCARRRSAGCATSPTPSRRSALWAADLFFWHLVGPARGGGRQRRRARAAAHAVRRLRDQHVDGAARPAAQAGLVRQLRQAQLHRRRAADVDRAGQRLRLEQRRVLRRLRRRASGRTASRRTPIRSSPARS